MMVLVVVFVLVSGLRMAELGHCGDRRTGAGPRRADAARPARRDPRAAPGTGPAPGHTGQGPGQQGVLLTGDPHPDPGRDGGVCGRRATSNGCAKEAGTVANSSPTSGVVATDGHGCGPRAVSFSVGRRVWGDTPWLVV